MPNHLGTCAHCDDLIAKRSLLQNTFYRRWTEGTLPVPALKDYARECGAFIRVISIGWKATGEPDVALREDGHARVWEQTFAAGLNTSVAEPEVKEVADLVSVARELFTDPVTSVGALYAFEAQQPLTARAKLNGLIEHYTELPRTLGEYFWLHTEDYDEPLLLATKMNALRPNDKVRAFNACDRMTQALDDALTGIHAPYVNQARA